MAAVASLDMSLNDSQAKQLRKIVEDYASYWQAEQASEPVDDARKFSLRLRKAASAFQVEIDKTGKIVIVAADATTGQLGESTEANEWDRI